MHAAACPPLHFDRTGALRNLARCEPTGRPHTGPRRRFIGRSRSSGVHWGAGETGNPGKGASISTHPKSDKPKSDKPKSAKSETTKSKTAALPAARPVSAGQTIIAIGASSGGLDASTRLIAQLPTGRNLVVILVQHFDPSHPSLMADLLSHHTSMQVSEAAEGTQIAPDNVYIIPPGKFLRVREKRLTLSPAADRQGARLPFDALLASLATEYGAAVRCFVLTGNGADGSVGLLAVKKAGGRVYVQSPDEAEFNAMPQSAIATGAADEVGSLDRLAELALAPAEPIAFPAGPDEPDEKAEAAALDEVIALLHTATGHDFELYKRGTIGRRVQRRIALAGGERSLEAYVQRLRTDSAECAALANDLLINVTSFFRDPKTFAHLEADALPGLIAAHDGKGHLRAWCAGCSTGEEAYSLAIALTEAVARSGRAIEVQLFATDVDPEAVAIARAGHYPASIADDVSPERLATCFVADEQGYKISSTLRGMVVFSVQDILRDPPFLRLDMISCRNVLIYLGHEAQAKALSLFNFALRPAGLLLLGSAETVAAAESLFTVVAKSERLYRQAGPQRHASVERGRAAVPPVNGIDASPLLSQLAQPARASSLAELCRRLLLEHFAPAAALIDQQDRCVYSIGPTDRYLRSPKGYPTTELFAMVPAAIRSRLKRALDKARTTGKPVQAPGGRNLQGEAFGLDIRPVAHGTQSLVLVCFVAQPIAKAATSQPTGPPEPRIRELEREVEAVKGDLDDALHELETSAEEQKAIDEEAMSVAEEYQSTNEELLTSKEELQSLNEELTALNGQLQETLERQKTTSNDLQNVLYSTDFATIFLDTELNIRFFTPATRALFNVIQGDVGRPLSDLNALSSDSALLSDAREVLKSLAPIEREVEARSGAWFIRKILPYRTQEGEIEGVVITFADITERRSVGEALARAEREARMANVAKSRFLAAASHDLRQPLQSLKLVQGLLARSMPDAKAQRLLARLDDTVGAMAGMLNSLLDINQIEAGVIVAHPVTFPVSDLLQRIENEFSYIAQAQGLTLRVVHSGLHIVSDPRLLEQMIRNLLANAVKYTKSGKVLLGCRRSGKRVRIEVWDTGIGIAKGELKAIFDEYHQVDNAARERSLGLGLGLSIVKRLGELLAHPIDVRSTLRRGSAFSISVPSAPATGPVTVPPVDASTETAAQAATGTILVIEDDPELRELLALLLGADGRQLVVANDGHQALQLLADGGLRPDVVLADFNLPNGMDGVEAIADIRARLRYNAPAIILTGDISTLALTHIRLQDCLHFTKPVAANALSRAVNTLLDARARPALAGAAALPVALAASQGTAPPGLVYIVDDDKDVRDVLRLAIEQGGHAVEAHESAEGFLAAYKPQKHACLLIDAYLPGMGGIELLAHLAAEGKSLPAIMITGESDVTMAVDAMKAGAIDFIEKPVGLPELQRAVARAFEHAQNAAAAAQWRDEAAARISALTPRQRQIMTLVLAGHPNKIIAADLHLSQRTVENHRAAIMRKTETQSLPALARLALTAAPEGR
jgi:two-component system CheB/CheR fusion protein